MSRCADGQKNRCKHEATQYLDGPVCTLHYNREMRRRAIEEWKSTAIEVCTGVPGKRHRPTAWRWILTTQRRVYCRECLRYQEIPWEIWTKNQI